MHTLSSLLGYVSALVLVTNAIITNITIDDTWGDEMTKALPVYTGPWATAESCAKDRSPPECSSVTVDASKAFNNTYHNVFRDVSIFANVTFSFNGTDLYVFFILPDFAGYSTNLPGTDVTMLLDGGVHVSGTVPSTGSQFTATGFAIHDLAPKTHTVKMYRSSIAPNSTYSVVFDYAIYTSDVKNASFKQNEPPFPPVDGFSDSSVQKTSKAAIIGGTIATVFSCTVAFLFCRRFCCYRRFPVISNEITIINRG